MSGKGFVLSVICIGLAFYLWYNWSSIPFLRSIRAPQNPTAMIITSPSFDPAQAIPKKFTCDGGDMNPELDISNVPENAKSLALIVDDPDAPSGTWTHWTVWNIRPDTTIIKEESVPPGATEGRTSKGDAAFHGPCPPSGASHHYHFKLYALDAMLELSAGATRTELEEQITKHQLAETELIGTYAR